MVKVMTIIILSSLACVLLSCTIAYWSANEQDSIQGKKPQVQEGSGRT